MTQSPFYESPEDYGSSSSNNTNKTFITIIIILLLLILCCCCTALVVLWFTGDSIIEMSEGLNILSAMLYRNGS